MATDTPTTVPKQMSAPAYTKSLWAGKRSIIIAFLFFNMFINYMDRTNLSVAMPIISKLFKWDAVTMGWILTCYLLTYMVFLIPCGRLTDRYGSRNVGAVSMLIWSLAGMASGASMGLGSMLAARLGLGVGEAASFPICGKVVRQWFPASERGLATAIFNAGTFAGPALSAPFVAWLVLQAGWRLSFVITGLIGVLWAILWFRFFRAPKECTWLPEDERNYLLSQTSAPPKAAAAGQPGPTKGALRLLLSRKTMWGQFITQGCCAYTMYLFLAWLPSYLVKERHMDLMKASWFTAMPYLLSVVFGILIGKLSDSILTPEAVKQGKRRHLLIVFILLSSVVLVTNLVSNQWVVVVLIAFALTSISSALTLNIAMCNDLVWDPSMAATALGFQILGGNSLGFLAPILTGYIVRSTGSFNSAFILAGCLLFLGAATSLTMTRKPLAFGEDEMALAR
jgi:ACS family glucarate transporter-like MFS transporter